MLHNSCFDIRMDIMRQQLQATLRIREMILRGELSPGQRVAESAIAQKFDLSRTPIRQALPALAEEGLLVRTGKRGYAVRVFTIGEIVTALDARATLEGMVARMLTERGVSNALIRTLKRCLDQGDELFASGRIEKSDEIRYGGVAGEPEGRAEQLGDDNEGDSASHVVSREATAEDRKSVV